MFVAHSIRTGASKKRNKSMSLLYVAFFFLHLHLLLKANEHDDRIARVHIEFRSSSDRSRRIISLGANQTCDEIDSWHRKPFSLLLSQAAANVEARKCGSVP